MSRTNRGSKGSGYDYWSRRPHSGSGFGPEIKKACHRSERMQMKESLSKEVRYALENTND